VGYISQASPAQQGKPATKKPAQDCASSIFFLLSFPGPGGPNCHVCHGNFESTLIFLLHGLLPRDKSVTF
ncbi:hypothetical protein, partial [Megasphaera elsdenii]